MSKPVDPVQVAKHHNWLRMGKAKRDEIRGKYWRKRLPKEGALIVRDPPEEMDVSELTLYDNEGIG
jgi:hypothetical protein